MVFNVVPGAHDNDESDPLSIKDINNILAARGRFACGDEYHERHHVTPKCMGGSNEEDNLIDLYAREHFEAHRLLALENPDSEQLAYAWWAMTHCRNQYQERYVVSAEEYEEAKKAWSEKYSESIRGENHWDVSGENNPMYGKHHTEEVKQKISQINTGRPNPMRGKKRSEATKKKMSAKAKERLKDKEKHPMYGKHHSEDTKKKISEKAKERYKDSENHPGARQVIRLSDLKIYSSLIMASKDNGISRCTMINRCKKHKDFMYYDEYLIENQNLGSESYNEL